LDNTDAKRSKSRLRVRSDWGRGPIVTGWTGRTEDWWRAASRAPCSLGTMRTVMGARFDGRRRQSMLGGAVANPPRDRRPGWRTSGRPVALCRAGGWRSKKLWRTITDLGPAPRIMRIGDRDSRAPPTEPLLPLSVGTSTSTGRGASGGRVAAARAKPKAHVTAGPGRPRRSLSVRTCSPGGRRRPYVGFFPPWERNEPGIPPGRWAAWVVRSRDGHPTCGQRVP